MTDTRPSYPHLEFPFSELEHHPDDPNWERPWGSGDASDSGGGSDDDWVDPALQDLYDAFDE